MSQQPLFVPPARPTAVRVGPAGWSYKDWEGIVYPAGAGRKFDQLGYLADYFDTVEINSSFYRPPRPQDAAAWAERVARNPRFRFTAKAWERITHEKGGDEAALAESCEAVRQGMAPLQEAGALGALLVQFPWSFRYSPESLEYLDRVFRRLEGFPLVVEVRHASWASDAVFQFLRERGVGFCNIDQPVMGRSLRPSAHVTSEVGYFRMHGRNYQTWFKEGAGRDARYDYLYTKREIEQCGALVRSIRDSPTAKETYAIMNNHFRGQAVVNALDLVKELEGSHPEAPPQLAAVYPHLQDLPSQP